MSLLQDRSEGIARRDGVSTAADDVKNCDECPAATTAVSRLSLNEVS
jgi:hypothetical protein